ncbi:hypothetical protein EYR38_009479 [Pleurotus pulmonarius]|nr:hypothetical protein EYR38_009479 [Pleurotus pulmonarius]
MDNPSTTSSTPVTDAEQAGWQEIEEITRKLTEEFRIKDQTSKSRGYEISGMTCVLSSAYEIPTDNPAVLYTSQPRGSDYAVEFLLHGAAAKRELIEYPDYPQEPYRPSELKERPYSIVEISGKGLGMVATKDLAPGDLIVAERPLLVAPRLLRTLGSVVFNDNATKEQQEAAKSFETEKTIRYAYDRMRPEDQAAYMKLHNAHLHDGSGPLFGIMRTNRYALFDLQALPDDLLLRPSLTMLELLESEGLEATRHYAQVLYHSMLIYSALGESSTNECLHFMARWAKLKRWDAGGSNPAERGKHDLEKVEIATPESPRGTDGMANSANAKESKEEIFRKMEETAHRLTEEYEFVDATTPTIARGYTRAHGDYAFRVVPTGEPIPDATFVSAVYSTQPQGCDPAAGTAECILHSSAAKRELLAYPGYPTPLPHAPGGAGAAQACPPYRIVNIPRKGLGMVAARDLAFGEVITNERPLLVAPQYILLDFIRWLRAPSGWENQQAALFETQRFYRMAYERMRGEDKVAYLQLYNAHAHDGSGPLLGVQRTNSFLMFELQELMGAPRPEGAGYRGKWMQLTALDRARSFGALAKYKEDREKRKMAAKVEKTNEEIFRQMEETSIKLMEEFKIQDSTSKSRGYICGGGFTYKLVPVGQPAPDDDSLVYTTQPQGCDPEAGMVECVLQNSAAKKELVEYPGYPAPIPREADSPASCPYRIVEIPSKGLGMVAARDLHFGELIISERPLMITPQRTIHSIKWMDSATPRQKQEAVYFESEKIHKVALERMEPEDKEAYMQLYNSHKHDGSGPIVGISRTNAYGVFALQGDIL